MRVISLCIPIIATILGVGFPILLQVITKLEEKYSSGSIVELFNAEKEKKFFIFYLIISLVSALIWYIIGNCTRLLVDLNSHYLVIFTTWLIIFFFIFIKKILLYYSPIRFTNYLIDKAKKGNENFSFEAISELFYYAIRTQNEKISRTLSRFLYDTFRDKRVLTPDEAIEYPSSYYTLVYKSIEEITLLKQNRLKFLEPKTIGGLWLFGEFDDCKISKTTFNWVWRNLLLVIKYENDNMVLSYWERAHQYFSFNLKIIQQKYSDTDYSVINNNEIENREKERKRFLDFHYALGGLLLYKGRYNCISRILNFTTSMPPRYELLPASINEILVLYFYFLDPHEVNFPWISSKYYFPELEGIESDYIIKKWISTYFALLLIRHCVLEPMQKASIPPTQGEKRFWINNLNYFKELINNVLETRDLISSLGYEFLNKDWCKENDKSYPPDFIEALRNTIIEKFANAETEQEISSTKITKFQTSTNGILVKCIEKYNNIYNSISIDSDFNSFYINGIMTTNDKSAFAEDQGFEHLNYDSVFANSISNKYKNGISEQFDINKSKSYLIKHDQIFDAIDQLNINSKEFIIVSFGQNIQYYIKNIGVKGLTEHKYKSIDCIHFSECNYQSIGQSLFIIRKTDFPFKIHLEPTQAVRDKYSLTPLNNKYEIYTSVLNLNNEPEILKELTKPNQEKDLKKSVLINIFLSVEMRWKKNINLIQIRSYSEYSERGLPDNLKDVEKFE